MRKSIGAYKRNMKTSGTVAILFGMMLIFNPPAAGAFVIILGVISVLVGVINTKK